MQQGSIAISSRKQGPDVWQFRWSERGVHGERIYRRKVIGTVSEYSDAHAARRAVAGLLHEINSDHPRKNSCRMTVTECVIISNSASWEEKTTGAAILQRTHIAFTSSGGLFHIGELSRSVMLDRLQSSYGFVGCRSPRVAVRRSETCFRSSSTMLADTSSSTAIQSPSSGKGQRVGQCPPCLRRPRSSYCSPIWDSESGQSCFSPLPLACDRASYSHCNGAT
jgi:hypothetical protein